jgi:prepilin-type N-terminal cleavage/methylation domain-containing protein
VSAAVIRLKRIREEQRGFTIVEMLSAMAVFGIVLGTFSMVLSSSIRHSGEVEQQTNLQVEARSAITTVAQDLRQVYDGDANVATSPILSMTGTQLTFYSPDRLAPFHMRRVTYRLNAGKFEKAFLTSSDTDGSPWIGVSTNPTAFRTVVRDVVNATVFTYKKADGTPATTPLDVKTIDVSFVVATKTTPSRQYTYESSVTVRGES